MTNSNNHLNENLRIFKQKHLSYLSDVTFEGKGIQSPTPL